VERTVEGRGIYGDVVGRLEGKKPLGRRTRRREDNIKMVLREIQIDGANWIRLAQDGVQWRAFVKVKVKLSLYFLTKHNAMKAYWGSGCIAPLIL